MFGKDGRDIPPTLQCSIKNGVSVYERKAVGTIGELKNHLFITVSAIYGDSHVSRESLEQSAQNIMKKMTHIRSLSQTITPGDSGRNVILICRHSYRNPSMLSAKFFPLW